MFKIQWSVEFFDKTPFTTELKSFKAQNILSWWSFRTTIKETRANGKLKSTSNNANNGVFKKYFSTQIQKTWYINQSIKNYSKVTGVTPFSKEDDYEIEKTYVNNHLLFKPTTSCVIAVGYTVDQASSITRGPPDFFVDFCFNFIFAVVCISSHAQLENHTVCQWYRCTVDSH